MITQVLATGASDCELVGDGLLAQPVNTLSALAFVGVGVWIATRFWWPSGAFGVLVAALGVGSIGYHGWDGPGVEAIHNLTNAAVPLTIIGFEVTRARRGDRRPAGYLVGVGALGVGLTMNLLGGSDAPLCASRSPLQWHGVWHVAVAVAIGAWAWAAFAPADRREVRWDGSTARRRSSPVPARGSAGA